jgi:hypothetical protein
LHGILYLNSSVGAGSFLVNSYSIAGAALKRLRIAATALPFINIIRDLQKLHRLLLMTRGIEDWDSFLNCR